MLTIDASVWLNANEPAEPNHAASRALLDHVLATHTPVTVPTLLLAEAAGTLGRKRGDSILAKDYATKLRSLPFIHWVALDLALAAQAANLAADRALRGADAVYAAVAVAHGTILVSLDGEHLNRLPPLLTTLTPRDALIHLGLPVP